MATAQRLSPSPPLYHYRLLHCNSTEPPLETTRSRTHYARAHSPHAKPDVWQPLRSIFSSLNITFSGHLCQRASHRRQQPCCKHFACFESREPKPLLSSRCYLSRRSSSLNDLHSFLVVPFSSTGASYWPRQPPKRTFQTLQPDSGDNRPALRRGYKPGDRKHGAELSFANASYLSASVSGGLHITAGVIAKGLCVYVACTVQQEKLLFQTIGGCASGGALPISRATLSATRVASL